MATQVLLMIVLCTLQNVVVYVFVSVIYIWNYLQSWIFDILFVN